MRRRSFVSLGLLLCCLSMIAQCRSEETQNDEPQDLIISETDNEQDTIILVSDPYPPYVMDGPPGAQGYITDAAILIFKKAGFNAVYENVPYERALAGLERGQYDGLLAVSPGRKNYVYPQGNLGFFENKFFSRKDFTWEWKGKESLDGLVLSAVKGYGYDDGGVIDSYIAENENDNTRVELAYGTQPLTQNLKKLTLRRVDLVFDDSLALWYTAERLDISNKIQEIDSYTDETVEPIVVGFNLNHPRAREFVDIMTQGIAAIKESGELDAILKTYHLQNHIHY